ncbi:MAG: EamA family transporter [Puniceicoccaceae bacterium]|nr:MAG: EamA family transporter [Puniceicoccaceae bacterium]
MIHLLLVSLIWAFSFGLIKNHLAGVDASLVTLLRLLLALAVFLPFFRWSGLGRDWLWAKLMGIGAVQYGVMYLAYLNAFRFLQAHEIALLTITTPLFVCWINDLWTHRWHPVHLGAAVLSVAGAGVLVYARVDGAPALAGLLLIQLSNACFAFGQLAYRRIRERHPGPPDRAWFALLFAGGILAAIVIPSPGAATATAVGDLATAQWLVLVYLGVIASGAGFFLWNYGATQVNAGTLAAMNNIKIPLAILVSLLVFGEEADWSRLLLGGLLMVAGVAWAERSKKPAPTRSS